MFGLRHPNISQPDPKQITNNQNFQSLTLDFQRPPSYSHSTMKKKKITKTFVSDPLGKCGCGHLMSRKQTETAESMTAVAERLQKPDYGLFTEVLRNKGDDGFYAWDSVEVHMNTSPFPERIGFWEMIRRWWKSE